jgi:hypothetical protein
VRLNQKFATLHAPRAAFISVCLLPSLKCEQSIGNFVRLLQESAPRHLTHPSLPPARDPITRISSLVSALKTTIICTTTPTSA